MNNKSMTECSLTLIVRILVGDSYKMTSNDTKIKQ